MRSTAAAVAVVGAASASAQGGVGQRAQKRACASINKWTIDISLSTISFALIYFRCMHARAFNMFAATRAVRATPVK